MMKGKSLRKLNVLRMEKKQLMGIMNLIYIIIYILLIIKINNI